MKTFGHDVPKLSWLGGKTFPTSLGDRKGRSGRKPEHTEALIENGIGALAKTELNARLETAGKMLPSETK